MTSPPPFGSSRSHPSPSSADDLDPASPRQTLYSTSPHAPIDKRAARRKLKQQHRSGQLLNPNYITLFILFLALVYWFLPTTSNIVPVYLYSRNFFPSYRLVSSSSEPNIVYHPSSSSKMAWQKAFILSSKSKGCHLVTNEIQPHIQEGLKGTKIGMLTLFIQHTSAALSLNENFDRDVRSDMDMALDKIVPETFPWKHTDEGPDDSVSHTKASIIGPSITIPITDGRLNLGTWQGIYLCEFRKLAHKRRIVATILS